MCLLHTTSSWNVLHCHTRFQGTTIAAVTGATTPFKLIYSHHCPTQITLHVLLPVFCMLYYVCLHLCRQVCSLEHARSDFQAVARIKPNHSEATKELRLLSEIQATVAELEQMASVAAAGAINAAAAQALLDKVYKIAPDCIPAQLLEAKLTMAQQKYEEVRSSKAAYSFLRLAEMAACDSCRSQKQLHDQRHCGSTAYELIVFKTVPAAEAGSRHRNCNGSERVHLKLPTRQYRIVT